MMRFFCTLHGILHELGFLLLLLLLLLITGDRTKNGPLGFIGLDFYERFTRGWVVVVGLDSPRTQ